MTPQAHAEIRQREARETEERRAEEGTYEDMVYGMLLGFLLSVMMCFFMVRRRSHTDTRKSRMQIHMHTILDGTAATSVADTCTRRDREETDLTHCDACSGTRVCRGEPSMASSPASAATSRLVFYACTRSRNLTSCAHSTHHAPSVQ